MTTETKGPRGAVVPTLEQVLAWVRSASLLVRHVVNERGRVDGRLSEDAESLDSQVAGVEARLERLLETPTPEDVARDAKRVWNAIPTSMHGEFLDGAWSRLRDAAAHGAALVARVARLEGEAIVLQADKNATESERDAALKREEAVSDHLQMMGVSSMESLADDFARLQKERDAARTAAASEMVLREDEEKECTRLRKRVATLERERDDAREALDNAGVEDEGIAAGINVLVSQRNGITARVEAAERRVAELSDRLRTLELAAGAVVAKADAERIANLTRALKGTSPTHPAPAGLLEAVKDTLDKARQALAAERLKRRPSQATVSEWLLVVTVLEPLAAYDAAKGGAAREGHPTTAHAKSVVTRLEEMLSVMDDGTVGRRNVIGRVGMLLDRAAKWDAAAERAKDRDALDDSVRRALDNASDNNHARAAAAVDAMLHLLGLDTPPSGPGGGAEEEPELPPSLAAVPDPKPGSECNPTPSAPLTPASLAAVVEAYIVTDNAPMNGTDDDTPPREARALGRAEGARAVLSRATCGQVPSVLLEARVVEVLACLLAEQHGFVPAGCPESMLGANARGWYDCAVTAAQRLGLTLPGVEPKAADLEARHPRVTPDVPALVWCEDGHHWDTKDGDLPSDGRQDVRCVRCPAVATRLRMDVRTYRIPNRPEASESAPVCGHTTDSRGMLAVCKRPPHTDDVPHRWEEQRGTVAESAAPEVVGMIDGGEVPVNLHPDGDVTFGTPQHPLENVTEGWLIEGCGTLARAPAEAKREQRCDHGNPKDYCAKEYEDAQERAARKAAEDMRERAALVAFDGTCATCHRAIVWDEHGGEAATGAWNHVEPACGCMVDPNGSPLAAARIRALMLSSDEVPRSS